MEADGFRISSGMESATLRHSFAAASVFNCWMLRGGSGRETGSPFSAAAFHSLTLTRVPSGVTRSALHALVSARRSGYSYPWMRVTTDPSGRVCVTQLSRPESGSSMSGQGTTSLAGSKASPPPRTRSTSSERDPAPLPSSKVTCASGGSGLSVPRASPRVTFPWGAAS